MRLALFDLDNTLLGGDSDHAWGVFLCDRGVLDPTYYKQRNDQFYEDYVAGKLDMAAYLNFSMEVLGKHELAKMHALHAEFMQECVEPIILPKSLALLEKHRAAGDKLVIITATNRFITEPIAARLGVETLLATECEMIDGRYTGRSTDVPCFSEGKVTRLNRWMQENGFNLEDSIFYSDSMNDLPLLEAVTHPVVVDADKRLTAEAERRGWPQMSLRD
jgi:HAD superfamily hydrolase (TIGR01490 family)